MAKRMIGRVSNQTAEAPVTSTEKVKFPREVGTHSDFPEVRKMQDVFSINVKVDDDETGDKKTVYSNDNEPFEYYEAPSLASALKLEGAKLDDNQMQFLNEALKGSEETGKAVQALLKVYNQDAKDSAKTSRYSSVFNEHKPLTDENIQNAHASIVRNFMKTNRVSDETALNTLHQFGIVPKDFTLDDFRGNKGKR